MNLHFFLLCVPTYLLFDEMLNDLSDSEFNINNNTIIN